MKYSHQHIDESDKLAYVDGELDEATAVAVDDHLAVCMECRETVDDLAAASDGLTAYLQRADYAPRVLAYRGARSSSWRSRSWAIAAALALFWGAGVPAAWMFFRTAPAAVPAPFPVAAPFPTPAVPPGSAEPALAPVASSPIERPPRSDDANAPAIPVPNEFMVDVTSWQAGGGLTLLFSDSDVVIYNGIDADGSSSSINTLRGQIVISTTADSRAVHEVVLPSGYGPENVVVRVAGRVVPFTVSATRSSTASAFDANINAIARIDLRFRGNDM